MNLQMDITAAEKYKSGSQRARILTETWAQANLYCAQCDSNILDELPANSQAVDFRCSSCSSSYQLKSQKVPIGDRIVDAGYSAMCRAILSNKTPNLVVLHYDLQTCRVRNVILIPSFGFSLSAIEPRRPLGPLARRAGWVGCNIVLRNIPADLRIPLVNSDEVIPSQRVRQGYQALSSLQKANAVNRGWVLDVLSVARSFQKQQFNLADLYDHEDYLKKLHPNNLHIKAKVRQQLQKLRDLGIIEFLGDGKYQLRPSIN